MPDEHFNQSTLWFSVRSKIEVMLIQGTTRVWDQIEFFKNGSHDIHFSSPNVQVSTVPGFFTYSGTVCWMTKNKV